MQCISIDEISATWSKTLTAAASLTDGRQCGSGWCRRGGGGGCEELAGVVVDDLVLDDVQTVEARRRHIVLRGCRYLRQQCGVDLTRKPRAEASAFYIIISIQT